MPEQPFTFPIGAWVRDIPAGALTGGIERGRFRATGGEIVGTGTLAGQPVYRVRFAAHDSIVFASDATCYQCEARDDESHEIMCCAYPDGPIRGAEHEPGWGASSEALAAWKARYHLQTA